MRSTLRLLFFATAALTASAVLYLAFTLPPRTIRLSGSVPPTQVSGAYHIHTVRSDGSGTVDEVARAASAAGLSFVILTDHGDATRPPDPPAYEHGVLVIDAVEVNTDGGHVVALGLDASSPYPLAGSPRDVIDDIHRLGGKAVVAHPDSPRPDLSWRGPLNGFDGIEWLNADSEWRNKPPRRLIATAARYLFRPPEAIASLFERPGRSLQRWDSANRVAPVFGLAALDAHARIGWREGEEPRRLTAIDRPTYEAMFRTLAQTVVLDRPIGRDARTDAAAVLAAMVAGRSFSIIRAFAEPASLEFTATQAGVIHTMGDRLTPSADDTIFHAVVPQAPGARVVLLRDGRQMAAGQGGVDWRGPAPAGVYRIEALLPACPLPWIASNAITIEGGPGRGPRVPPPAEGDDGPRETVHLDDAPGAWTVEREPTSSGALETGAGALKFDFRLGDGVPHGQYAALVTSGRTDAGIGRIGFVGRASAPMRISVQVRLPGGRDGQRWRRSVYLDTTPRTIDLPLDEFEPTDAQTSRRPIVAPVQSLMFVIDTVNTKPSTAGAIWISDVTVESRRLGK